VENHRSKTPSPNSPRKADEIWAQRASRSESGAELFTIREAAADFDPEDKEEVRFLRVAEARTFERGEIERGMKFFC
jgi:hypothetical protein